MLTSYQAEKQCVEAIQGQSKSEKTRLRHGPDHKLLINR